MSSLGGLDAQVPAEYEKQAFSRIIRAIINQVNSLSEGRLSAKYNAQTTIPTGTNYAYAKGDFVPDSNPTVTGSVSPGLAASYVRIGWYCVASGSPGTFKEARVLIGS